MAARGVEYGVGTRNPFDLLDDDDDDQSAKKAVKKEEPAKAKTAAPAAAKSANKVSASIPAVDEPRKDNRNPRGQGRGGAREPRKDKDAAQHIAPRIGEKPASRKREFDRRSGPSRVGGGDAGQKRDGAGQYNWGSEKDVIEFSDEVSSDRPRGRGRGGRGGRGRGRGRGRGGDVSAAPPATEGEAPKTEEGAAPAEGAPAEGAEAAPVEEVQAFVQVEDDEPKVKTFDEYLAEKQAKALEDDLKREIRQPDNDSAEGLRACAPLAKDEEKEEEEKASKAKKEKAKKQAVPKLSLDQFVGTAPRAGGRGGARGGRGGRQGGERPFRANLDSEDNFPSLRR